MRTRASSWLAVLLPVVLVWGGGLAPQGAAGADPVAVTAVAEGREIRAMAGGVVTINTSGTNATVNLGRHVLQVDKARLQLDDQMPSDIPAETRLVEVQVDKEMLTVKADGKEVLRAKLD